MSKERQLTRIRRVTQGYNFLFSKLPLFIVEPGSSGTCKLFNGTFEMVEPKLVSLESEDWWRIAGLEVKLL